MLSSKSKFTRSNQAFIAAMDFSVCEVLYGRVSALAAIIIQQATDGVDPTNWFPGFFHQQLSEIILVGEERFCIIFD